MSKEADVKKQYGFTFIELIIVVLLLGILAATAIPRFANFSHLSKHAGLMGLIGSIRSAAMLSRIACLTNDLCDEHAAIGSNVVLEGSDIYMRYGYPEHSARGIMQAVLLEGIETTLIQDDGDDSVLGVRFYLSDNCHATYRAPSSSGQPPQIESNRIGCPAPEDEL